MARKAKYLQQDGIDAFLQDKILGEDNPLQAPVDNVMINICTYYLNRLPPGRRQNSNKRFVSHPWGRVTLVASQLTVAFACHYPHHFFRLFDDLSSSSVIF